MLAEQCLELLTAYVDGQLSARQQRLVQKLLKKSPEARTLLRKLQQDSHELMELPPPPPAPDMTLPVMQAIVQRGVHPHRRRRPAGTIPLWRGAAAAAAVLLLAAGASFLFFKELGENGKQGYVLHAHKPSPPGPSNNSNIAHPGPVDKDVAKKDAREPKPDDPPERNPGTNVVKEPDKKPDPDKVPMPPEKPDPSGISTAQGMQVINPHEAEIALPTLLRVRDLNQEKPRQTLIQELSRHDAYYVELLCREATQAFPRLQAALQAGGYEVVVDGPVQQRLKQPQPRTNYLVYLDNVTAEELAKLLLPLGQEDPKADNKAPVYGQFLSNDANLILCPMAAEHRRKVLDYLGADPRRAKATGPLGVDLTRPLSDQTADQLSGDKAGSRPASKSDRSALAMVHGVTPRSQSVEVKRYHDSHKPVRKGTLQIFLVLRGRS